MAGTTIPLPRAASLLAALLAAGCGGAKSSTVSPSPTVSSLIITGTAPAIGATAQFTATAELSTGTTQDVTAQATWRSSNTDVATVSTSGVVTAVAAGDADIRATYQNFTGAKGISIAPLPCRFAVSPASVTLPSAAEPATITITVTQGSRCDWTAAATSSFITIAGASSGTGSGTVSIAVAPNFGAARSGSVTIGDQTVDVTQEAGNICLSTISPASRSYGDSGPTPGSVSVAAPPTCAWTATSHTSFITITGGGTGTGNGVVSYSVAAHSEGSSRTGTISIGRLTFTVTQEPRVCPATVSPASFNIDGAGRGNFPLPGGPALTIALEMSGPCAWTASTNAPSWIGVDTPSGSGSRTVSVRVYQNNSGATRTGTITVAGLQVSVTQTACVFSLSPSAVTVGSAGSNISFTAQGTTGCIYNFNRTTDFLVVPSQSIGYNGTATIVIGVPQNPGTSPRTETLKMEGRESDGLRTLVATATVTQSGTP